MENNNISLEEKYGVVNKYNNVDNTTRAVNNNGVQLMQYDVVDESLKTGKPLEQIFEEMRFNDITTINDAGYYKAKYGVKANPGNPNAIEDDAIDKYLVKAKVLSEENAKYKKMGTTSGEVSTYSRLKAMQGASKAFILNPYMGETTGTPSYQGFYNPENGSYATSGTEQEMAEFNPMMYVSTDKGLRAVNKPTSQKEMDDLYGDGKSVVTTMRDPNTGRPTLVALPSNSFVRESEQYSTKFGAQKMFGNGWDDFWKGTYNGAWSHTMRSFGQVKGLLNDFMHYDDSYIFSQGKSVVNNYSNKVLSTLKKEGNIKGAEMLVAAMKSGDYNQLSEAYKYAYANLDPTTAHTLKREAQPLNWQKMDFEIQQLFNDWTNASYAISQSTKESKTAGAYVANFGETIGMLVPQIAIALATSGFGTALTSGATATQLSGRLLANKILGFGARALTYTVGTSQSVGSDFYRSAIEAGMDNKAIGETYIYALPVMFMTEKFTNGWMFKSATDPVRRTLVNDVWKPGAAEIAKVFGKEGVTEGEKQAVVQNVFKKLFKNESFKKWMEKGSFGADMVKANVSELAQENLEDSFYQALEYHLDSNAPMWAEVGKGKTDATGWFVSGDQLLNTSAGTIFATTIMQTLLSGVPRMIRRAKGMPDTNKDKERDQFLLWKVLDGNSDQVATDMFEGYQRGEFDGEPGTAPIKLTDGFISPEEAGNYVVPENKYLQQFGFKAGEQIQTVGQARFIEAITTLSSFNDMSKNMGLSDLDKSLLFGFGFKGKMLLQESFDSYKSMAETKLSMDEYQAANGLKIDEVLAKQKNNEKAKPENVQTLTDKETELLTLYKKYQEAKVKFDFNNVIEKGTNHTAAINHLMKSSTTLVTQVENEMNKLLGNAEGTAIPMEIRKQPDFAKKYQQALNNFVERNFDYDSYKNILDQLNDFKVMSDEQRSQMKSALENKTDFNAIMEVSNRMTENVTNLNKEYSRKALTNVLEDFSTFTKQLTQHLTSNQSLINNQELDQLRTKYKEHYQQVKQAVEAANINEVDNIDDEGQAKLNKDEIAELERNYRTGLTAQLYDKTGNPVTVGIHLNKETPQYVDGKIGRKLNRVPFRNETDEQYNERIAKMTEYANQNYSNYLEEMAVKKQKDIEELSVWVDSVINNTGEYKRRYPTGVYNNSDAASIARKILESLEQEKQILLNSFTIAKSITGQKNYENHVTKEESKMTEALANDTNDGLKNKFASIYSQIDDLKSKIGQAEFIDSNKDAHMRTVMVENTIHSLKEITANGLMVDANTKLTDPILDELNKLKDLDKSIIEANGNYTNAQLELLAKRKNIANNVLSFLQNNKKVVFNDFNKSNVFGIFEAFQTHKLASSENGDYDVQAGSMFYQADATAVSGSTEKVLESRETMMIPLRKGDSYFFDGKSGATQNTDLFKFRLKEHLNVISWINSEYSINDITDVRKKMLLENRDIETEEQEYVVNSVISFLTGNNTYKLLFDHLNKNGLYDKYEKELIDGKPVRAKHKNSKGELVNNSYTANPLFNAITITGDYGVGKTQFVFKQAVDILTRLEANKEQKTIKNATIVSITNNLKTVHKDTFSPILSEGTKFVDFKKEFVDNLDNLDVSENMLYIVDEASILTMNEYDAIVKRFNEGKAKIIFLGDIFQMRPADAKGNLPHVITRTFNTHLLTKQFSSNSSLLRKLAEEPRSKAIGDGTGTEIPTMWNIPVFSKMVDGKLMGAHYYLSETEMAKTFSTGLTNTSKRAIIFANQAHLDAFLSKAETEVSEAIKANMDKVYFAFRMGNAETSHLIQGLREEEVYVMVNPVTAKTEFGILSDAIVSSALYTSIGRASNFVGLINNNQSLNVSNENLALSIGQPVSESNPIIEDMKKQFKAKTDFFYSFISSDNYRTNKAETTVTNPVNPTQKGSKKTLTVNATINNVDTKVYITVDPENDTVDAVYKYKGHNQNIGISQANLSQQSDEIITNEVISQINDRHKAPTNTFTKTDVSYAYFANGNHITITDYIEVNGKKGMVNSITEVNDNGIVSYEVNLDGNIIVLTPASIVRSIEFDDNQSSPETLPILKSTVSVNKYYENKNLFTIWSTSASLVNMKAGSSIQERNARRNLNDYLLRNIQTQLAVHNPVLVKKTITYLNDNNEEVTGLAIVLEVEVPTAMAEEIYAKGKTMYKEFEKPKSKMEIAVCTYPSVPVPMQPNSKGEVWFRFESFNKFFGTTEFNETTRKAIELEWNKYQFPNDKKNDLRNKMRDMHLAIFDLFNSTETQFAVKSFLPGEAKIEYSANAQSLYEFVDSQQHVLELTSARIGKNKKGERRIIVNTSKGELICTMPKFEQNPISWLEVQNTIAKQMNAFDNTIKNAKVTGQSLIDALQIDFMRTSLAKLIMENYAFLKANPDIANKLTLGLINIKDNHHIDIVGDSHITVTENYKRIIANIKSITSTDVSQLYDYAEVDTIGGKHVLTNHKGIPLLEDTTFLFTHATRINNTSIYPQFDRPNVPQSGNKPEPTKTTIGRSNIKFEHVENTSGQTGTLNVWLNELDQFLGSDFAKQYLDVTSNILRDEDGRLVAGYVSNGRMVLSTLTGKTTTAKHESYHWVYQNYLNPLKRIQLNYAARIVAMKEQNKDITGNEEEWMAYDFARSRNMDKYKGSKDVKTAVGILERFKQFMRNLLKRLNPVYYANKILVNQYNSIIEGKYRNESKIVRTEGVSYSHDVDQFEEQIESEYNMAINSEQYVSTREAIIEANKAKKNLKETLVTNQAIVQNELMLGFDLVDMSIFGTSESISDIHETIESIVSKHTNERIQAANEKVTVVYQQQTKQMTLKEVENKNLGKYIIGYDDQLKYDNYVIDKEENIRALLQLKLPSYNMLTGEWGSKAGPDERFDWSRYKPEDYLSDDKKLFLSAIPRLKADGNLDTENTTFIPFNTITSVMKELGSMVIPSNFKSLPNEENKFMTLKSVMEFVLSKSVIENDHYVDERSQVIHSIYSRLFGEYNGIKPFYGVSLMDKYVGLANNIMHLSSTLENEDGFVVPNAEFRNMYEISNTINNFVNGITTIYSSMYMKDMLKTTYYNNTVKTIHMFRETYKSDSKTIENKQMYSIENGTTTKAMADKLNETLSFDVEEDFVSIKSIEDDSIILTFDNINGWAFVDEDSMLSNSPNADYTTVLNFLEKYKSNIGLGIMRPGTLKTILAAKSWNEVTDAITVAKTGNEGWFENFMTDIVHNFETPAAFMANYIGTVLTIYNQYNKPYSISEVNEEGEISVTPVTLNNYIRNNFEANKSLLDRINAIEGTTPIIKFLEKTQPQTIGNFEYTEDSESGAEVDEESDSSYRYINFQDLWVSNDLLASIIQKVENKVNDGSRRTAEGTTMHPYISRSAFNDQFLQAATTTTYGITFKSIVESLGVAKNIGFTTYGKKVIETPDFIETSLNMFGQYLLKRNVFVPVKPASDTGVVRYFDIATDFISFDRGVSMNYNKIGNAILDISKNHEKNVRESNKRVNKFIEELKTKPEFSSLQLDATTQSVSMMIDNINKAVVGNPELLNKLIEYVDHSELVKDVKIYKEDTMSNFDIGFKGVYDDTQKKMVITGILPGRTAMNDVKNMQWLNFKPKGNKTYIQKIEKALKENDVNQVKDLIHTLFGHEYRKWADMSTAFDYKPANSVLMLMNKMNGANMKDVKKFYEKTSNGYTNNEFFMSFFITTMLANNAFETVGMDAYSFDGYMDMVKRFGSDNTPGISPVINDQVDGKYTGGLLNNTPIMPYRDIRDITEPTFKTVNGKRELSVDDAIEVMNGQVMVNPLWFRFFRNSFGGDEQSILGSSKAIKPLGNMKRTDGSYLLLKSAFSVISGSDMQHQGLRNMFIRMLAESDKIFATTNEMSGVENYETFTGLFNQLYDESTTKDIEQVLDDMHMIIVSNWQSKYGKKFYENAVNSIVGMMPPTSTIKSPLRQLNSYNPLEEQEGAEYAFDTLDNNFLRAVMNPAQPVNTNKSQAQPSQFDAQMGVGGFNVMSISKRYRNNRALLQNHIEIAIKKEISQQPDKNGNKVSSENKFSAINFNEVDPYDLGSKMYDKAFEQLENFLREKIVADLSVNDEELGYINLMSEQDVSRHLPVMRSRMLATYRNYVNQSVQGRTPGIRLTQMSGYFHRYYTDESGNKLSYNDVLDRMHEDGWKSLSFEQYSSVTEEQITAAGFTVHSLEDMKPGEKNTSAGTISMPNIFAEKYGHRKDESLHVINTVKIGTERIPLLVGTETNANVIFETLINKLNELNDANDMNQYIQVLQNFMFSPMIRKAIANLKIYEDTEMISQAVDTNNPLSENASEILRQKYDRIISGQNEDEEIDNSILLGKKNWIENISGRKYEDMTTTERITYLSMENLVNSKEMLLQRIINEATELSYDFNKSLTLMLSRVPLTFIGSGGIYETAIFNNDNGNIVYIPVGMTNRNDADFDIDALTAYANAIGKNGKLIKDKSMGVINKMNDERIAVFLDKENEAQVILKSTTKNIKSVVSSKKDSFIHNSPLAIFKAYDNNKAGADAIGILDNALNAISMIMTMKLENKVAYSPTSLIGSIMKDNITNMKVVMGDQSIIYRLGSWEQIALDNNKSNTLGAYNIRSYVVNILASMVIAGKTPEQIHNFFNNERVNEIFNNYAKGQRINKDETFDLYTLTKEYLSSLDTYIKNDTSLKYWNKVNNTEEAKNVISTLNFDNTSKLRNSVNDAITILNDNINLMLLGTAEKSGIITQYEGTSKHSQYLNDKITPEEGIAKFRTEHGFDEQQILDGSNVIDEKELPELYAHIKAIQELNRKLDAIEGQSIIASLPDYITMAEALFRTSQIMQLRNGLKVLDGDFNRSRLMVENALGMSLKEFTNTEKVNDVNEHIRWFMVNNEQAIKLQNELKMNYSKNTENKLDLLIQKEKAVFNELNVSAFCRMVPQLENIIRMFDEQETISQLMFMSDNVEFKNLSMEFMELQNKGNIVFPNQLSKFYDAIYELAFDKYFNDLTGEHVLTMNNTSYDFTNVFDRQEFAISFPAYAIRIQSNASDPNFWKSLLSFEEYMKIDEKQMLELQNNQFIKSLAISGLTRNRLSTSVVTKNMVSTELAKYQDAFNAMPESIKKMFLYYEIIENKMNFRKGSIMHIIGTDFYRGDLSKTFNDIYKNMFQNKLATFTGSTDTIDALKDKFFDYLGMNEEFAVYTEYGASNKMAGPKYIWNYGVGKTINGQKIAGKKVQFYKKDESGNYRPINKNTWKPVISVNTDTNSEYKTFLRKSEETELYRFNESKGRVTTHIGTTDFVKGQILVSGKDVVVVTNVSKGQFNYRSATNDDKLSWNKILNEEVINMNNSILFVPGTAEYQLLHGDSVYPITVNKTMAVKINGESILVEGEKFGTMNEMMEAFYNRIVKTIPEWKSDVKSDYHLTNIIKNLFVQANSINDVNADKKQAVVLGLLEISPVVFKEAFKQRFADFESTGNKVSDVLLDDQNAKRRFDNTHSKKIIGRSSYENLVHQAYLEYIGKNDDIMDHENEVIAALSAENINSLFFKAKKGISDFIGSSYSNDNASNVPTSELKDRINYRSAEINLDDNNLIYTDGTNKWMRLGNMISWAKQKLETTKASYAEFTKYMSGSEESKQKAYAAYKEGRYIISREAKQSMALEIGTAVDESLRSYFEWYGKELQMRKDDPSYAGTVFPIDNIVNPVGFKFSKEQKKQLMEVMTKYATAWSNWASANGFDIEFITDEIRVTSNYNSKLINNTFDYYDASGNKVNVDGIGSKTDMVIRLTKTNGGQTRTSDIVVDFKTINMDNKKNIESTLLGWGIQTYTSSIMYQNNYGVSLYNKNGIVHGILPIQTIYENKEFKGFDIPNTFTKNNKKIPVLSTVEYWSNNDKNENENKYLPLFRSMLDEKTKTLCDTLVYGLPDKGNNFKSEYNDQNEDGETELNCKIK